MLVCTTEFPVQLTCWHAAGLQIRFGKIKRLKIKLIRNGKGFAMDVTHSKLNVL